MPADIIRESYSKKQPVEPPVTMKMGIVVPGPIEAGLGRWERQSVPLRVSNEYKELITELTFYFEKEMTAIGDDTLSRESDILKKLGNYN